MTSAFEFVGTAIAVPVLVAAAIVFFGKWRSDHEDTGRYVVPLAFAAAMAVGYLLLPAPLVPSRHWHWLMPVGLLAAVAGTVTTYRTTRPGYLVVILAVLSCFAAWALVPTWDTLHPPRRILAPGFALYLFCLTFLLQRLRPALNNRLLVALMAWSGLSIAALAAAFVSVRYAKLGLIASAALVGSGLTTQLAHQVVTVRSLTPAFVHVMGGCALVSAIEPQEPLIGFAILPLLPLLVIGLMAWSQAGIRVGKVPILPWVPAIGITALAAFWMYLAIQAEAPDLPEADEPAIVEEDFFQ